MVILGNRIKDMKLFTRIFEAREWVQGFLLAHFMKKKREGKLEKFKITTFLTEN